MVPRISISKMGNKVWSFQTPLLVNQNPVSVHVADYLLLRIDLRLYFSINPGLGWFGFLELSFSYSAIGLNYWL